MKTAAVLGAALLVLTGCAANETPDAGDTGNASTLSGTLSGEGASSQDAAQQQGWIPAFQTAHKNVTINYAPSGSGTGREAFQKGGVAFAGSDRAFKTSEIEKGPFEACTTPDLVQIPAYISPIAIIVNVEGVKELNLDADTMAKIFTGKIKEINVGTWIISILFALMFFLTR